MMDYGNQSYKKRYHVAKNQAERTEEKTLVSGYGLSVIKNKAGNHRIG